MGTLPGELKQSVLNNRRAQAILQAKRGRKIIVVGAMLSNLPPGLRDHPLIEVWQGDSGLNRHHIPDTAGLVLSTRFVSHHDLERLREEAHRKDVEFWPQPFTTGDLREILGPLAIVPEKVSEPSRLVNQGVVVATVQAEEVRVTAGNGGVKPTARGALKRFVAAYANFHAGTDVSEANRLLPLAQQEPDMGTVTRGSLLTEYRTQRKAAKFPPRHVGDFKGRPRADVAVMVNPATMDLQKPIVSTDAEVLRLFDEAVTKMQDGIAAVQLAKERYGQLVDQQKSTRDIKTLLANLAAQL